MSAETPEEPKVASTSASGQRNVAIGGEVRDSTIITGDSNVIYVGAQPRKIPWRRIVPGGVLVAALGVAAFVFYPRPAPPPAPVLPPMTGELNVAVAEFGALDAQGTAIESADGQGLSSLLYSTLGDSLNAINASAATAEQRFVIQVRGPTDVGRINGGTPEARADAAKATAEAANAHVLIYGYLDQRANMPSFVPQFYLANLQDTPELQGQHDLGPPVPMLSLTDIEARRTVRTEVSVRARTFAEFAIGLSLFASDKYGDARVHFLNAANNADWKPEAGKENVYLLLGYTSGKLGDLADARKNFEEARRLNPEFARAYLGLGEVAFQESLGAPEACARDHVNAAGIQSAIQLYKQALSARVQPVLSNVPSATALSLGRAYLCLSQADVGDFWADAEREFTTVIDAYNADHARGNESARDLASDAHSNLGFVSLPGRCAADRDQRYRKAAQEYQSAIDLSQLHRGRQGFYYEMLGYIDTQLGALDDARTAYRNAMRVDDANTDHYSQLLQDVQPPAPEQCP